MKIYKTLIMHVLNFLINMSVGLVLFIFISFVAIALRSLIIYLEANSFDSFIIMALKGFQYLIFSIDILLFMVFIIRTSIRTAKQIINEEESRDSLNKLNIAIIFISVFIGIISVLINYYDGLFSSIKNIFGGLADYVYPVSFSIILISVFILLNRYFIKQIKAFILKEHSPEEIFRELLTVFITGISNILIFTFAYAFFGISSNGVAIESDLITSLYFSIVTWTTLGYGDLSPISSLRLVASLEALMGYIYMAVIIGLFLNVVKIKVK